MKGPVLKQCIMQNASSEIKQLIVHLGAQWTIEDLLERASAIPTGNMAMLVNAMKELATEMKEQNQTAQMQVMAALAPLQEASLAKGKQTSGARSKQRCYRCGGLGHMRRECKATNLWCNRCQSSSHNSSACRAKSGNERPSAPYHSRRAPTQVAAAVSCRESDTQRPTFSQQQQEASAWTWQPQ